MKQKPKPRQEPFNPEEFSALHPNIANWLMKRGAFPYIYDIIRSWDAKIPHIAKWEFILRVPSNLYPVVIFGLAQHGLAMKTSFDTNILADEPIHYFVEFEHNFLEKQDVDSDPDKSVC